ncbi:MAG TPA: hypothetical protein VEI83_11800 [Acidimicrobiales bacterium]|nr:hypothetical protein [Acidimicrobiales bacterium]
MAITGSGNLLQCDVPECGTPPLAIPAGLFSHQDKVKRQWAVARGWTSDLEWDNCPTHSLMRPSEMGLAIVGEP